MPEMETPKREIQTAVVTGPTGVVGHALCACLIRNGIRVYAVCRPGTVRAESLPRSENLTLLFCDSSEFSTLPERLPRADAFFHLAWSDTASALRNHLPAQVRNIGHTLDACRAAKELGCKVFVGAGSQAEYGRVSGALKPDTPCFPENGYGMAKLCAGQMSRLECHKLGLIHIWPRILSVYGPYDGAGTMISSVIRKLLAGECPALTAGEQLWDYLYADDAAEALFQMALNGKDGAVYPLGSGQAHPLREYVEILRDAIDPRLPLGFGEIPYGPRQVMCLKADLNALSADTGFSPKANFETGIHETIEWIRKVQLETG